MVRSTSNMTNVFDLIEHKHVVGSTLSPSLTKKSMDAFESCKSNIVFMISTPKNIPASLAISFAVHKSGLVRIERVVISPSGASSWIECLISDIK